MRRILSVFAAIVLALGLALPSSADSFTPDQKAELESLIHSYLMDHPEVLRDMAQALDLRDKRVADEQRGKVLSSAGKDIFHNGIDAVVGNPNGDVTVVEFMDYNCGWCRKSIKEIQSIVGSDPKVRVVMKEFPIFGDGSEYAARAALAAVKQGKYWELHQALFATEGKVTADVVDQVAKKVGLDVAKLKSDMKDPAIDANIAKTAQLAETLQFTGTPGFIVDTKVFPGYEPKDALMAAIAEVRANGGCKAC
ncbi:MAG: DsbA family protein [Alphaproteobacteria bacterium]|nr:DsbA family protein [Alphaproteobacteria bacterium]